MAEGLGWKGKDWFTYFALPRLPMFLSQVEELRPSLDHYGLRVCHVDKFNGDLYVGAA